MRERRALATRLDRRHPSALLREIGTAHGVDAAIDPMEVSDPHLVTHCVWRQPGPVELIDRDHSMLVCSNPFDEFSVHTHR
jgi:hypothetical protein